MRHLLLALVLAFAYAPSATAAHADPGNDAVDNGLAAGDPAYFSFSWDEGGSSFAFFDGLNQLFRFEPYLAWNDGGGLAVESLSTFDTTTFATTSGPTFTPRAGPPDSHSHVAETRENGVLRVAATGSIADGAQVFAWDAAITNVQLLPLSDVSLTLYLDADMGLLFDDDHGDHFGSTTSPFDDLILRIFDPGGSGMGLGAGALAPSSFEVGDGGTLLGKVRTGAALSNAIDAGPGELAAALRFDLGALGLDASTSAGGLVYANPVPEPGSFGLVACGLAGLAASARRRARR